MNAQRHPAEHTATIVERLAILLEGGTTPASAWRHLAQLADDDGPDATFWQRLRGRVPVREATERTVARGLARGVPLPDLLKEHPEPAWRILACAWSLAERTGSPLARCLGDLAESFRDVGLAEREVSIALAGPQMTARLVSALPLAGLGLGVMLGFGSVQTLLTNPLGIACLVLGLAFLAAGHAWNRRLVATASKRPPHPGLALDLAALGMLGGGAASEVRAGVERALSRCGIESGDLGHVDTVLALSSAAGVPATVLLRSEAALARREARTAAARRAAELGVKLMLPLGVCTLPAFMLLGVAPLVISVIASTVGAR